MAAHFSCTCTTLIACGSFPLTVGKFSISISLETMLLFPPQPDLAQALHGHAFHRRTRALQQWSADASASRVGVLDRQLAW